MADSQSELLEGTADEAGMAAARASSRGHYRGVPLVRVPLTTPRVPALDGVLTRDGAARRYALAGNVAFVSWPQPLDRSFPTR